MCNTKVAFCSSFFLITLNLTKNVMMLWTSVSFTNANLDANTKRVWKPFAQVSKQHWKSTASPTFRSKVHEEYKDSHGENITSPQNKHWLPGSQLVLDLVVILISHKLFTIVKHEQLYPSVCASWKPVDLPPSLCLHLSPSLFFHILTHTPMLPPASISTYPSPQAGGGINISCGVCLRGIASPLLWGPNAVTHQLWPPPPTSKPRSSQSTLPPSWGEAGVVANAWPCRGSLWPGGS